MNNYRGTVRKRRAAHPDSISDRRVERTTRALGSAMTALMLERPFDDITVQDVLDRAGVGRATFYTHFRNKRDLFLSGYERMLDAMERHLAHDAPDSRRVAPVAEFFAHVATAGALLNALRQSNQIGLMWELGVAHFARMIQRRVELLSPRRANEWSSVAASQFCAGALIELLKWWLDRDVRPTAQEMDVMYHEMIWRALEALPVRARMQ